MHGQGFSSYLNVFCLFVFCVATRGAAQKRFVLVYLFVLRPGISHLKFINSNKINEAFLRFMTYAYRLQWITNDVLQKPNQVTLIRSIAKLQLLKFDARFLYFERASYFAKLNLLSTEFFVCILAHLLFVKL